MAEASALLDSSIAEGGSPVSIFAKNGIYVLCNTNRIDSRENGIFNEKYLFS